MRTPWGAYSLQATRSMEIENVRVLQNLICARKYGIRPISAVRALETTVAGMRTGFTGRSSKEGKEICGGHHYTRTSSL